MIYTLTCNPSLDYIMKVHDFSPTAVNRTADANLIAGGKGINVAVMLSHFDVPVTALGFVAGFTGDEIMRQLRQWGCTEDFIRVEDGLSRINVKVKSDAEFEINGAGPHLNTTDVDRLFAQLDTLTADDYLVVSGSIPAGLPVTLYSDILSRLTPRGVRCIVDATGSLLNETLPHRPLLVKPNHHELEELLDRPLPDIAHLLDGAKELQQRGARHVLISRAGDGALLLTDDGRAYTANAPHGIVRNSVGAGDSMVAGFLAGLRNDGDIESAFRLAVAAGSASAFDDWLAPKDAVCRLLTQIEISTVAL
ncbi:1-phosphofructokinase [uncultured Veillonella sp.]|uniref:1-phosphofructokinase n=1 Tax=uncultured Veillonella sp. TaxID=159268 RepID=UPI0025927122|nr:1-phosphofructokinase [uncultured Veillonella sp.]